MPSPELRKPWSTRLIPYAFVGPSLLLFAVFAFLPIVLSVVISLQDVAVFGGGTWNGGAHYPRMAQDPLFWLSLRNTMIFAVGTVPTSMAIGLGLAIALNRKLPGRGLLRAAFFLPVIASGVVVAVCMSWLFNSDYGVVDNALELVGLPRIPWLTSPNWAMVTLVIAVVWTRVGFCMVIYLAALQSIPTMLTESITLDGAGRWARFRHLTWPMLMPTTFLLLVVNMVFSLQAFDIVYVMTGGGPGFATTILIQYIFRTAFSYGEMGYASALGVVFTLLLLVFTLLRWRSAKRAEELV